MIVKKKQGKIVQAYRLGEQGKVIKSLIEEGLILEREDGLYEIFSQEAINGKGEIASANYYIKVDSAGKPYPNNPNFFEKNHKKVGVDLYEQIPAELLAWTVEEKLCEEMSFLIDNKKLYINEENKKKYFNAFLWGSNLSAPKDAVIVFYEVVRNKKGKITEVDFNFVRRDEFDKTYNIIK